MLLGALLVRLPFLCDDPRVSADLELMRGWARIMAEHGIAAVSSQTEVTHHQPISLYLIGLAGWIEALLPGAWRHGDAALNALIKLPALLADVATAGLLAYGLRHHGSHVQLRAAALHAFNPGVWYLSALWGQTDAIYAFFLLATMMALRVNARAPAWVCYGLALATKLQSVFQAPLVWLTSALRTNVRAALSGAAAVVAMYVLLTIPWWATGQAWEFARASFHRPRLLVVSAYNFWYLVHLGDINRISAAAYPPGSPLSYAALGLLLFVCFGALVLALAWRRRASTDPALPAALLAIAPFALLPHMHERYLFPALPLLLWCAASCGDAAVRRQLWWGYGLLSFTFLYNLVTVGALGSMPWSNLFVLNPPYTPLIFALKTLAVMAAAINVGVLLWLTRMLLHQSKRRNDVSNSHISV